MKESAQIALNWIRSNDHRVSEITSYIYIATVYVCLLLLRNAVEDS